MRIYHWSWKFEFTFYFKLFTLHASAIFEISGPPGYGSFKDLATLSKASPAASSNVFPIFL